MKYLHTESASIDDLEPYPGNARIHDRNALAESARENGQYRSIVARELPGGALQILAGHGTVDAFRAAGASTVRVEVIDADDREARRIVLADNATSRNASYDERALLDLLDAASIDGGLTGTSWDSEAYEALLGAVTPDEHPEFDADDDDSLPRLDELNPIECPKCGHTFAPGA